jgi:peptidoglycan/xylan/chitin deacetylase (PgdA/CDA1 family)
LNCIPRPLARRSGNNLASRSEIKKAFNQDQSPMNFRLDRLASLYLALPLLRLMPGTNEELSIPVLMYHSVTSHEQPRVHPYYRTATSPAVFAEQLKFLREHGYSTCTVAEALEQLTAQTTGKSVVITFDDGYRNFYRDAFPLLTQYGFSATVYLPTAYIGETPNSFKGEDCLTWSEVRELRRNGIHFGSHTVTHPRLRELGVSAITDELVNSKETIEQKLGCAVDSFAYPYAFPQTDVDFTKMLRDSLRAAGYKNGVCTVVGRANRHSEPLFLERLPVNSCDDRSLFEAKLAGAYDWIGTSQYIFKKAKARFLGAQQPKLHVSNDFAWRPRAR